MMTSAFAIAVIAGGQSSRMGTDKSFVDIGGQPILGRILDSVRDLGQAETFLVANRPAAYTRFGLPIFSDVIPDKGSLGGIYTALYHSQQPYTLVVACDMPFLKPDLLRFLLSFRDVPPSPDVIVPRVDKYPQGLLAIYHKNCLSPIEARLNADKLKVIGFYPQVQVTYLDEKDYHPYDPDGHSFMNVNTPEELAEARRLAENRL
jgi:molybdopterin-guanine dinucleotide biosynthesis protein A